MNTASQKCSSIDRINVWPIEQPLFITSFICFFFVFFIFDFFFICYYCYHFSKLTLRLLDRSHNTERSFDSIYWCVECMKRVLSKYFAIFFLESFKNSHFKSQCVTQSETKWTQFIWINCYKNVQWPDVNHHQHCRRYIKMHLEETKHNIIKRNINKNGINKSERIDFIDHWWNVNWRRLHN